MTSKEKRGVWIAAVFAVVVIIGQYAGCGPEATSVQPVAPQACDFPDTGPVYDGKGHCHAGGELVMITQAIDGDEFRLADGRIVRLLGVTAPGLSECAGPEAAAYARERIAGGWANLLTTGEVDGLGRVRGYMQVNISAQPDVAGFGVPRYLDYDLGALESTYGWARSDDGANTAYAAMIAHNEETARSITRVGQFGPLCVAPEPPLAPLDDASTGPDAIPDVDVNVSPHDRNHRDGALTGGFCRRHRWC